MRLDLKDWGEDKFRYIRTVIADFRGESRYHITSSEEYNYTWFRVAKAGTRTILKTLVEKTAPEINGSYVHYDKRIHLNRFKFCFIRNPWSRMVSCYNDKVIRRISFKPCWGKDFEYFVNYVANKNLIYADRHICPQVYLAPVMDLDYVAKFENFSSEFEYIINERLGLNSSIIHQNLSKQIDYREYYNDQLIELVSVIYKEDISLGNYIFEK